MSEGFCNRLENCVDMQTDFCNFRRAKNIVDTLTDFIKCGKCTWFQKCIKCGNCIK